MSFSFMSPYLLLYSFLFFSLLFLFLTLLHSKYLSTVIEVTVNGLEIYTLASPRGYNVHYTPQYKPVPDDAPLVGLNMWSFFECETTERKGCGVIKAVHLKHGGKCVF